MVGAETGDLSELVSSVSGVSADGSTSNSASGKGGAFAFKVLNNSAAYCVLGNFVAARPRFKFYFRFSDGSTPASQISYYWARILSTGGSAAMAFIFFTQEADGTQTLEAADKDFANIVTVFLSGAQKLSANTWYRIEIDFTPGAGTGSCVIYINGVVMLTANSAQYTASSPGQWTALILTGDATRAYWMDDCEIDDASLCGESYVIARQIEIGTPTYDNWTKF